MESQSLRREEGAFSANPSPPRHAFERERLVSLERLNARCDRRDRLMNEIGRRAAELCQAPIGLVTLLYAEEQRFIGCVGVQASGAARDMSFCAHTILQAEPLVVHDALRDPRFRNNPYVMGEPHIRFYAGVAILDEVGLPLGSVCAADVVPREVSADRLPKLRRLASLAGVALEARRLLHESCDEPNQTVERLDGLLTALVEPLES